MPVRSVLPGAAVALALAAVSGCSAQGSSSPAQVRQAQAPQPTRCNELLRAAEVEMPNAVSFRVAGAREDIREARELCNSGQEEEGVTILQGVLNDLHEGG